MDYHYTWDETGNITEKATEHGTYSYGYDEVDRLTEAEYPTFSAEQWTYDPLGNRLTDTRTGSEQWQYNENNELLDSVEYRHEYDDNGSLITENNPDGTLYRTFEYNAENRVSAVKDSNGDLIAEYLYDPFGRRVKKTVYSPPGANPETTWYVYTDQGLMAELDQAGNSIDFYLFPPDGLWSTDPILRKSGSSYYYYQTDHLGTPQQLIDGSGAVVHSREMRGFGETAQTGVEDGWRFPGQLESREISSYYNGFRDYRYKSGLYIQIDPIGFIAGANLYRYSRSNPILLLDPMGLSWWRQFEDCMTRAVGGNLAFCEDLFWASATETAVETTRLACETIYRGLKCTSYCTLRVMIGTNFEEIAINSLERHIRKRVKETAKAVASKAARRLLDQAIPYERAIDAMRIIHCTWSCVPI